jgi:hypothetical protein
MERYGRHDQTNHHVSSVFTEVWSAANIRSFSCEAQLIPTMVALGMLIQYAIDYKSFINFFFMYVQDR